MFDINEKLIEYIKKIQNEYDLTQSEFSKLAGYHQTLISAVLKGRRIPTKKFLEDITVKLKNEGLPSEISNLLDERDEKRQHRKKINIISSVLEAGKDFSKNSMKSFERELLNKNDNIELWIELINRFSFKSNENTEFDNQLLLKLKPPEYFNSIKFALQGIRIYAVNYLSSLSATEIRAIFENFKKAIESFKKECKNEIDFKKFSFYIQINLKIIFSKLNEISNFESQEVSVLKKEIESFLNELTKQMFTYKDSVISEEESMMLIKFSNSLFENIKELTKRLLTENKNNKYLIDEWDNFLEISNKSLVLTYSSIIKEKFNFLSKDSNAIFVSQIAYGYAIKSLIKTKIEKDNLNQIMNDILMGETIGLLPLMFLESKIKNESLFYFYLSCLYSSKAYILSLSENNLYQRDLDNCYNFLSKIEINDTFKKNIEEELLLEFFRKERKNQISELIGNDNKIINFQKRNFVIYGFKKIKNTSTNEEKSISKGNIINFFDNSIVENDVVNYRNTTSNLIESDIINNLNISFPITSKPLIKFNIAIKKDTLNYMVEISLTLIINKSEYSLNGLTVYINGEEKKIKRKFVSSLLDINTQNIVISLSGVPNVNDDISEKTKNILKNIIFNNNEILNILIKE